MDWELYAAWFLGWATCKAAVELRRYAARRRLERADLTPSTRLVIRAVLRKYGAPGLFD